ARNSLSRQPPQPRACPRPISSSPPPPRATLSQSICIPVFSPSPLSPLEGDRRSIACCPCPCLLPTDMRGRERMASFRWLLQLHKDVLKAARFYCEGLGFTVNVCTLRWAELQSSPLNLVLMQSSRKQIHGPNQDYMMNGNDEQTLDGGSLIRGHIPDEMDCRRVLRSAPHI
ncbi:hypothetical protein EJ110_NYTH58872, partial [Nymphaea thermarum]